MSDRNNHAVLLRRICLLLAPRDVLLRCQCLDAAGGKADTARARRARRSEAIDPIRKWRTRFCCDAQHRLPVIVSTCSTGRHGRLPMRRREFITLLGGVAIAWPLAARAQQQLPVIGILSSRSRATDALLIAVIRQGLNDAGFIEGRNVSIEYRWAEGNYG